MAGVPVRPAAGLGLGAVAVCAVLVGALHVVAAARVDPVRRTLSEYALGAGGWMFDLGVTVLAAGSLLVLVALVGAGLTGRRAADTPGSAVRGSAVRGSAVRGAAVWGLAVWALALLVVVAFEKTNWSVGPSLGGYVHRYASLAAFLALPVAALGLGRRWRRHPRFGWFATATGVLGRLSLGWLATILLGVLLRPLTGVPWWQFLPLGLVERGLAVTEVAALTVMGLWAWRAGADPVNAPPASAAAAADPG